MLVAHHYCGSCVLSLRVSWRLHFCDLPCSQSVYSAPAKFTPFFSIPMSNKQELEELIARKIFEHEVKVAIISGIIGASVVAGIFHAIWLNKTLY